MAGSKLKRWTWARVGAELSVGASVGIAQPAGGLSCFFFFLSFFGTSVFVGVRVGQNQKTKDEQPDLMRDEVCEVSL